jgi:hypothetical protein
MAASDPADMFRLLRSFAGQELTGTLSMPAGQNSDVPQADGLISPATRE